MNKQDALSRLSAIEKETAELRKVIDAPQDIEGRVKSFEDACDVTGYSRNLPFKNPANKIQERINYDYMLYVITKALNESWELNWKDTNQDKWYPWMKYDTSSSAFVFDGSGDVVTRAVAGSGVRLASEKLSNYFGKQFQTLISNHLLTLQ